MKELKENPAYNRQESEPMYEYIDAEYFNRDKEELEAEARGCGAFVERFGCLGYTLHKVEVNVKINRKIITVLRHPSSKNLLNEFGKTLKLTTINTILIKCE